MRPTLFTIAGHSLPSYPAMLYLGLVAGIYAGNFAAHASGADPARVFTATIVLAFAAIAGARALFVATHWSFYRTRRQAIVDRRQGGMSLYGGLALALALSLPLLAALHVPYGQFWDCAAFTLLTGLIFTRAGCLLNGCCSGRPTTSRLSLTLRNHAGQSARRIPVQLIDAAWSALILLAAATFRADIHPPGALFALTLAAYAAARLLTDPLREAPPNRAYSYAALAAPTLFLLATHLPPTFVGRAPWPAPDPLVRPLLARTQSSRAHREPPFLNARAENTGHATRTVRPSHLRHHTDKPVLSFLERTHLPAAENGGHATRSVSLSYLRYAPISVSPFFGAPVSPPYPVFSAPSKPRAFAATSNTPVLCVWSFSALPPRISANSAVNGAPLPLPASRARNQFSVYAQSQAPPRSPHV